MSLREGPIYTTATRPSVGQINRYDASAGPLAVVLPALEDSAVGAPMMLQKDASDPTSNVVSFTTLDTDIFDDATTALSLSLPGAAYVLQVVSLSGVKYWKVMGGVLPGDLARLAPLNGQAPFSSNTSPQTGYINTYDASSAAITGTLPQLSLTNIGANFMICKATSDISPNTITFTCAGSDHFDDSMTWVVLAQPGEARTLQVVMIDGIKYWKITQTSMNASASALTLWAGTEAEYAALAPNYNPSTVYCIT